MVLIFATCHLPVSCDLAGSSLLSRRGFTLTACVFSAVAMAPVTSSEIKNISAWRLNKAETQELADRVKKGESEAEVKRELQTKKALACEERKRSAEAISSKGSTDPKPSAGSKTKKLPAKSATAVDLSKTDPTNASYYAEVEADLQSILKAFPGLDQEMPLCLSDSEKEWDKDWGSSPVRVAEGAECSGYPRRLPLLNPSLLASDPVLPDSRGANVSPPSA